MSSLFSLFIIEIRGVLKENNRLGTFETSSLTKHELDDSASCKADEEHWIT